MNRKLETAHGYRGAAAGSYYRVQVAPFGRGARGLRYREVVIVPASPMTKDEIDEALRVERMLRGL